MKNRIFVVVYNNKGGNRKLKSELSYMKEKIHKYLDKVDIKNFYKFKTNSGETLSDIIRIIK